MRSTYLWALLIAIALSAWLFSGEIGSDPDSYEASIAERNDQEQRLLADKVPTAVRVRNAVAQEKTRLTLVRGKTENKRTVAVRTETVGRITARQVERGDSVLTGDVLCEISVEDRFAALDEASKKVDQARLEYTGAQRLKAQGHFSENAIATALADLASAEATLKRRQLDMEKTRVRAPFAGIVEDVNLEVGDYVQPGQTCATIVDLNPMLLVGRVSERAVLELEPGIAATGILNDGRQVQGNITFIGQQSDPDTRTYAIEVEVDNQSQALRSGITTEILLPVERVMAHKVSPALFSLDDEGGYGIRTVDDNDIVHFYPVRLVDEDPDGVWVTGLPNQTKIITVGQELVVVGERVQPISSGLPGQTADVSDQRSAPGPRASVPGLKTAQAEG